MTNLEGAIQNVVTATESLISAAIHEEKRDDPESVGTLFEEKELAIRITELIKAIKEI